MNKIVVPAVVSLVAGAWLAAAATDPAVPLREHLTQSNAEGRSYALLQHLTDHIGPRLSGSPGAEAAIAWSETVLREAGLEVRREPVRVPVWIRGVEKGSVVAPARHTLVLTALGGSEPTPAGGLEAEIVEVDSVEALATLPAERVRGRIVFFNKRLPAPATSDEATSLYRVLSPLRSRGAAAAGARGAVGVLVRSAATGDNRLAHTGAMRYAPGGPRIPAAALALEDAELLHRLGASGKPVRVSFELGCRNAGEVDSSNVVADLRGRELPAEIVLVGAHLDSWDLGTGAIDDGAGVVAVMETMRLLQALPTRPRRTVRAVLFANEENGLRGGLAYAAQHEGDVARHAAAIESDGGAARPIALNAAVGEGGVERLRELLPLLGPTGIREVRATSSGGADISPLRARGVPAIGLHQDQRRYFDWHHTAADTLDKVDREDLARNVEALVLLTWALAEAEAGLPRPLPSPSGSPTPW